LKPSRGRFLLVWPPASATIVGSQSVMWYILVLTVPLTLVGRRGVPPETNPFCGYDPTDIYKHGMVN
jgi:hypothetical protein